MELPSSHIASTAEVAIVLFSKLPISERPCRYNAMKPLLVHEACDESISDEPVRDEGWLHWRSHCSSHPAVAN
jgi:hypothetical protein